MNRLVVILRRKRVWIPLALFIAYTLFGFLVLPGILRGQIVQGIRQNLKREAHLTRVRVNPLLLSLTLEGFELRDPDGTPFVAFDRLFFDFRLTSLARWALTFSKFELDQPKVHIRLMPDGKMNFDDLVPKEQGKPPRVVIGDFRIRHGQVGVTNLMAANPEKGTIVPIDLRLRNFTTIPQHEGVYQITATDPGNGSWQWTGELTFEPMHSAGVLEISGSRLRSWWEIAKNRVPFEIRDGRFGCRFQYAVDVHRDSLIARVHDTSLSVAGFAMRPTGVEPDLVTLDSVVVSGIEVRYPEQTTEIRRVLVAGTRIKAWINPDSTLNWQTAFAPGGAAPVVGSPPPPAGGHAASGSAARTVATPDSSAKVAASKGASAPPWAITLHELAIRDLGLAFEDRTTEPVFAMAVAPVNVTVRNISSRPGAVFDVQSDITIAEKGKLDVTGTAAAQPPAADLTLKLAGLPLPVMQPYLNPMMKVHLVSGTLGGDGALGVRVAAGQPDVRFKGSLESHDFLTRDRIDNERFLAWKTLAVKQIDFTTKRLSIASVRFTEPYAKLLVHKNRTTNVQEILGLPMDSTQVATAQMPKRHARPKKKSAEESAPVAPVKRVAAAPVYPVRVGKVEVVRGSADFGDLSLILPFAARVEKLNGSVSGLSSDSLTRAEVTLDGAIAPSGTAQVRGQVNPLADHPFMDLNVIFHGINMPVFTPYCGQFMGREVDKGKMSLDLTYQLEGKHLIGENKVVLDQFELGKKVDSPEATHLPVGLAIAILKDGDGQIHLDVPVEGDVDDPSFRLGKVIWNFIMNLLKKVALAPFALLGGLFGGGDHDELSHVDFTAGTAVVPEDQQASLVKLAEALDKRPALKIEVRGKVDSILDAEAMRKAKFTTIANEKLTSNPKKYGATLGYSPQLLAALCVDRLGKQAYEDLRERHKRAAGELDPKHPLYKAGSKKIVLDELALNAAIQDTLTALQPVDRTELLTLANGRSVAIKQQLVAKGVVEERVYLLAPEPGTVEKDHIRIDLTLTD
jgi:hypothetical protein